MSWLAQQLLYPWISVAVDTENSFDPSTWIQVLVENLEFLLFFFFLFS